MGSPATGNRRDAGSTITSMIALLVVVLLFAALGALAHRFGADTRDGRDWQPYDVNARHRRRV
jgi:hypothetical protein